MKKLDRIFREILYRVYECKELFLTQRALASACRVSRGFVCAAVARLEQLGAIEKKPLGFTVTDPKRVLMLWACTRNLWADVTYSSHVPELARAAEQLVSAGAILTAHAGYYHKFGGRKELETLFVYGPHEKIRRLIRAHEGEAANFYVLRPDPHLSKLSEDGVAPLGQIYVDLYNLGVAGKPLIHELDRKLESVKMDAFRTVLREVRRRFA
jgi:DNA-binding FadR family transcriptional regulator